MVETYFFFFFVYVSKVVGNKKKKRKLCMCVYKKKKVFGVRRRVGSRAFVYCCDCARWVWCSACCPGNARPPLTHHPTSHKSIQLRTVYGIHTRAPFHWENVLSLFFFLDGGWNFFLFFKVHWMESESDPLLLPFFKVFGFEFPHWELCPEYSVTHWTIAEPIRPESFLRLTS